MEAGFPVGGRADGVVCVAVGCALRGLMFFGLRSADGFQHCGAVVEIHKEPTSALWTELQTAFSPISGVAVDDMDEIHYPGVFFRPQYLITGFQLE